MIREVKESMTGKSENRRDLISGMFSSAVIDTLSVSFQNYLQGIERKKAVNLLAVAERFVVPVGMAVIMGFAFGTKGILASIPAGKVLLVIIMLAVIMIRCKGYPVLQRV